MSFEQIKTFLMAVGQLPRQRDIQPTIFEITGYPHLENVSSNLLAFYLQPNNPHGLGNSFLQALCRASNTLIDTQETISASIRTEESTTNNKRIDIIIETDTIIIGIENKIFHELNNDLRTYWRHLNSNAQGRTVLGIVLSLKPLKSSSTTNFNYITYEELFTQFESVSPHLDSSNRYHMFLLDFIRSIRNLVKGTTMDMDKINLFRHHQQEINDLLSEVGLLKKDMLQRLNRLADVLQLDQQNSKVKRGYWSPSNAAMEFLIYTIDINAQFMLQIDIFVQLSGWYMQFWNRKGDRHVVQQIISNHQIPHRIQHKPVWRVVYTGPCPSFETDVSDLRDWVAEVTDKLL